ncbi:MAG: hypothetical protein KDC16_03660 [Saprospiraceae bacterium]|nr:hypothetical protein [Saprospiraceae bacterium]
MKDLVPTFKIALVVFVFISLIGYSSYFITGIPNPTYDTYGNYPYVGSIHRLRGFSYTPNMHLSLLTIYGLTTFFNIRKLSRLDIFLVLGTLIAMILTFAKEQISSYIIFFVFFFLSYFKIDLNRRKFVNSFLWLFWILVSFITLFVFCFKDCNTKTWSLGPSVFSLFDTINLRPTGYYFLLKAEVYTFLHHYIKGIGFGNFQFYLSSLQSIGVYPNYMPVMMSHNLYSGLLAEVGLGILIVFFAFRQMFSRIMNFFASLSNTSISNFVYVLFWFLFFMGIGCSDYLFVRHHWIAIGIIGLLYFEYSLKITTISIIK